MSIWSKIENFFEDIKNVGWLFVLGRFSGALDRRRFSTYIPGFGWLTVRKGSSDLNVIRQVFRSREYDLSDFKQFERIQRCYDDLCKLESFPIIIDAGANIGATSIWFARKFPKAKILAVEPDAANAACLRANVAAIGNIEVVEGAIGSTPGFAAIINKVDEAWAFRTARVDQKEGVRIYSVSELVESRPCARLFIVKVDIEGFEADLFERDTDWLGQACVVFIEPHDWMLPGKGSSLSFQKAIARYDFEVLLKGELMIYVKM